MWQHTFKKIRTLNFFLKCVGTKSTHLKKKTFQTALGVYIHHNLLIPGHLTHFKKMYISQNMNFVLNRFRFSHIGKYYIQYFVTTKDPLQFPINYQYYLLD